MPTMPADPILRLAVAFAAIAERGHTSAAADALIMFAEGSVFRNKLARNMVRGGGIGP